MHHSLFHEIFVLSIMQRAEGMKGNEWRKGEKGKRQDEIASGMIDSSSLYVYSCIDFFLIYFFHP